MDEQGKLFERYILPPFTVLVSNQGAWRTRRRLWDELGITSEEGREDNLTFSSDSTDFVSTQIGKTGGTSVFNPVLCELMYRWFTPNTGSILDPFAGGSTRGVVAGRLGRSYVGVDLRPEQVASNEVQRQAVCPEAQVQWVCGDSLNLPTLLPQGELFDFVFSCPPYGDLETYSEDPRDLSNMTHEGFLGAYRDIIRYSTALLKPNRFAAFVVGNYRLKDGRLFDFGGETVRAFEAAGAKFYNQFILVSPAITLQLRVTKQFDTSRKAGMQHQLILVFVKGDARKATSEIGPVDPLYPGGIFNGSDDTQVLDLFTHEDT